MDGEMHCDHCQMKGIFWRCMDCVGGCFSCTECLRVNHKRLPFHRVESWDGDCFKPAWLYQAGVRIYLGHNGECCPSEEIQVDDDFEFDSSTPWLSQELGEEREEDWVDETLDMGPFPTSSGAGFPTFKKKSQKLILDSSGVHPMAISLCRCAGAEADDMQYLSMKLFPTSFKNIETVATFRLLDEARMENLECKTALRNIWNRLRRASAPLQPESVPVGVYLARSLIILIESF